MIDLYKYHIRFVKNPTQTMLDEYSDFPIKIGIGVFILYMGYALLANPQQTQITFDLLSSVFDINSFSIIYLFAVFSIVLGLINHYWVVPYILKFFTPVDAMDDGSSYRKIVFLSVLPYVIYCVILLLPLKLIAVLLLAFDLSIVAVGTKLVEGLLGIWLLVLIVQAYIMRWNGIKEAYQLSNFKVFAIIFLIPLIASIPTILIYGDSYLEFISRYI